MESSWSSICDQLQKLITYMLRVTEFLTTNRTTNQSVVFTYRQLTFTSKKSFFVVLVIIFRIFSRPLYFKKIIMRGSTCGEIVVEYPHDAEEFFKNRGRKSFTTSLKSVKFMDLCKMGNLNPKPCPLPLYLLNVTIVSWF